MLIATVMPLPLTVARSVTMWPWLRGTILTTRSPRGLRPDDARSQPGNGNALGQDFGHLHYGRFVRRLYDQDRPFWWFTGVGVQNPSLCSVWKRTQRVVRPGKTSINSAGTWEQIGSANGQRGTRRQDAGGSIGEVDSPVRGMRCLTWSG